MQDVSNNLVQSLNSPFYPPHIGAEPGRAKEESRIHILIAWGRGQLRINFTRIFKVFRRFWGVFKCLS